MIQHPPFKFQKFIAIFIYSLAALFLLYEMALQVSPSIMTHQLMGDFKIGAATLGLMSSVYFFSYAIMQIPAGILYDYFSPRVLITISAFVCAVGSFFFGATHTVEYAALGRLLMGAGSAFAFIGVLVIASRWFPPHYFAFLVGIAQLLAALGALAGELPLAIFVNASGWRAVMIFLSIIGFVLTLLSFFVIRDKPHEDKHLVKRHHIFAELKEIFKSAQTWWIALYAFSGWGPVALFAALWGIPYLMLRYGISNTWAASACAMIWIGIGITSPIIGWISDKIGRRCVLIQICSFVGLFASLLILYVPNIPFSLMFLLLFCVGIAGGGQILTFALVKDNNRPFVTGTAIGLNNMAVVAGGAIFQPLIGFILHALWHGRMEENVPIYSLENYHIGLMLLPLCFLIGLIASTFLIKETNCRPKYDTYLDSLK